MLEALWFPEIIVRFDFNSLRIGGDNKKSRLARTMFVEQPHQVWANRRVGRNRDGELTAVCLGCEFDARNIQPHFGWPGIELPGGAHDVGRADLDCDRIKMLQRWSGALRCKGPKAKLKAQNKD